MHTAHFKMWMWVLIGLNVVVKSRGYASIPFPQACGSMSPLHLNDVTGKLFERQTTEPPFELQYSHGKDGEITVFLLGKASEQFRGFMLEAREQGKVDEGRPVGQFILLDDDTQLLSCGDVKDSAVIQKNNGRKFSIKANWTAQGETLDITFRATFIRSFGTFWEGVDVNVMPPPQTTSKPTTTNPNTSKPTTTNPTTSKPTTTNLTTSKPTTTNPTTSKPTTTNPTTSKPTTTNPTTSKPTTTNPSTAGSATKQSTTVTSMSISSPITVAKVSKSQHANRIKVAGIMAMSFDSLIVVLRLELSNIFTIFLGSTFSHRLNKGLKMTCSVLCAAAEISALVLFCVGDFNKVVFVPLVIVTIVINLIELVIVSLPIGPSHELKEICNITVKVCTVIHVIFTIAVMFIGVLDIDSCRRDERESWLVTVMSVYTAWIFLFIIWVFIFSIHSNTRLWKRKTGDTSERWKQQRQKKKLSAGEVTAGGVSVILAAGITAFTAAVLYGILGCQNN